jgi:hypothetical protein
MPAELSQKKCVEACRLWMNDNPALTTVMAISCFAYSSIGLGLVYTHTFMPPAYYPFTNSDAWFWLGVSMTLQGPASYLGDVYSVLYLDSNNTVFSNIDRCMATTNAILGFLAFSGVHTTLTEERHMPHRLCLGALATLWCIAVTVTFPTALKYWRQGNIPEWFFWHLSWHVFPIALCDAALVVLTHHAA